MPAGLVCRILPCISLVNEGDLALLAGDLLNGLV
jgi:hypothetical protein